MGIECMGGGTMLKGPGENTGEQALCLGLAVENTIFVTQANGI